MLDLNPDIVRGIIERAREFHAQEAVVLPNDPGDDSDWAMQSLAAHVDNPTFVELKVAISELEPDQQVSLLALMWLGRGDFSEDDWSEALAEAGDRWNPRVAEYLIGTPMVADYLREGLELLGYSEEE